MVLSHLILNDTVKLEVDFSSRTKVIGIPVYFVLLRDIGLLLRDIGPAILI